MQANTINYNVEELLALAEQYEDTTPAQSIEYAQKGLELIEKNADKFLEARFLKVLAYTYFHSGTSQLALQYYTDAINICRTYLVEEKSFLVKLLSGIAAVHKFRKEYTQASNYYFQALKYDIEQLNDKIYDNIASLYFIQKDYDTAIQYLHQGLEIAKKYKNHRITNSIFANIGVIQYAKGDKIKAIEYFEEGFKVSKEHQFTRISSYTLMNIGDTYTSMQEYEKGLTYYFKAKPFIVQNTYIHDEALWNQKIGYSYFLQKNYEVALTYYLEANRVAEENKLEGHLPSDILDKLQKTYHAKGDFETAYNYQSQLVVRQKKTIEAAHSNELKNTLQQKEEEIFILKDKNKKINQQNAILRQFSHIVAHDLKAPLRNISGFTSLLNRRYASLFDDRAQEYMTYVKDNVQQMHEMLTDLLAFVTLENEDRVPEKINLNEVLTQVTSNLRITIDNQNVVLKIADLPNIKGHRVHIVQLFQNLIQNAIKFKRDTPPTISVTVEKLVDRYRFSIKDNGIGIDELSQERIFQIFRRLHKNEKKYKGTGIGLAICQKIVEMHGGRIWVESEVGVGSTFFFTIVI